jgi:hypothetical protein
MPDHEDGGGYDVELQERLIAEADDPDLTARLIAEFQQAERDEERIGAEQRRTYDELFDGLRDDEFNRDDDDDDASFRLSEIRESLAEARRDRALEEKNLEHRNADWERTGGRITDLQERFPDLDARPEVVDIELGGLYAVSEGQWTGTERQKLVVELARQREQHYDALLAVAERMHSLEQLAVRERAPIYASGSTTPVSSLMLWVAVVAGVIFAGTGLNELTYVSNRPHAYGPARVIAWACGAALLVSIAVGGIARDVASRARRDG